MTRSLQPLPFHRFAYDSARGGWEFLIAPPPPDLVGIVESFWISRGQVTFLHEKILPQNNVELMFNLERPFGVPNRPPDRTVQARLDLRHAAGMADGHARSTMRPNRRTC